MAALVEYLNSLGPYNWGLVAGLLFLLETLIPGVHFLWFGLAAVVMLMVCVALLNLMPEIGAAFTLEWQLITYALLAVSTVFFVRRFSNVTDEVTDTPHLNVRGQQYVGRVVTVAEPIVGGRGKVSVGDTLWTASGDDAPEGASVRITGVSGTVLAVERV